MDEKTSASYHHAPDADGPVAGQRQGSTARHRAHRHSSHAAPSGTSALRAARSPDHLLKQEASRDGSLSTTTYTDFGKEMTISMPTEDRTMAEFRTAIDGG